jgi:D-beta-D-heptose 7-phosphate kinase / D-beta-D-heptose 1-phosphate adenosyltransferase
MNARILDLAQRFQDLRVLVIGESMLDSYLEGYTDRLSREAPVPVVTVTDRKDAAGGAANTAVNIAALGGQVTFLSVIGDDDEGRALKRVLEKLGVKTDCMVIRPERRTLAKRRVSAGGQMLVRFDQGDTEPIDGVTEAQLIEQLGRLFPHVDGIIISDYGYGVLTPRVADVLQDLQLWHRRPVFADAKDLTRYRGLSPTAVKPNYGETVKLLGLPRIEGACARAEQIAPHADRVLDMTGAQIAAITLDTEGALVCERGNVPYRTYANAQPDSRATGAGDTFVSGLTLSLLAGADTADAAEIAQAAARIVVSKPGTTTCTADELRSLFLGSDKYYTDPTSLTERLASERTGCRRVVFTNGCFDILHRGHITYLNQAKALGDILVVAVNTDESVQRLKGPTRPINGLEDRLQVLAGLSSVDYLLSFDDQTPARLLELIQPDVFVKGGDYTRETLPEAAVVESYGGSVQFLPYIENRSTTNMIARIRDAQVQESYRFPVEELEVVARAAAAETSADG